MNRRMVKKGETVLAEEPFVFVLNSALKKERCDFCFGLKELKKCSKCQYVFYCSRNCQRSSWHLHKLECENLKKILPKILPDSAHLLIRIILKLQMEKNCDNHSPKKKRRPFHDLMSHLSEIKEDSRRIEKFVSLSMVLKSFFSENDSPNENFLLELFGKMCINSFTILDDDMNGIGTGIYLDASRLDHSCEPNAVAVFEGTTVYIRLIENLTDFDLNMIKISYIDVLNTPTQRKQELQSMYYFLCDCPRCCDAEEDRRMNSMKCPNEKCSGYVPVIEQNAKSSSCTLCETQVDEKNIQQYLEVVQLSEYHLQCMKNKDMAYLDVCKMILKKQDGILHDFNVRKIKTLDLAFEACINLQRWDDAVNYGIPLVSGFRLYYGQYSPLTGHLCMKILKLILLNDDIKESKVFYHQAEEILAVTHGSSHPLYRVLQELYYG